ncbi:MAG: type 1 glutamine amidotransferase [Deltaproteobacteria bacterium]|nr:type 1 glutamine amidotransferase [Deltaproteobacteria bacterium]
MPKLLVLQHASAEGLGTLESELKEKKFELDVRHLYKGDPLPGEEEFFKNYVGIVSMGGPMSVNDQKRHPFLANEEKLIVAALERKRPILGICLGAQMLARACGMKVYKGPKKEIGWHEVHLDDWFAKRNPLFFQLKEPLVVFQWHQETFDVPVEGYRLAKSEHYPCQAFCFNGNAHGLQFHPEMTEAMIRTWVGESHGELTPTEVERILEETPVHLSSLQKMARKIVTGFASICRDSNTQASGL